MGYYLMAVPTVVLADCYVGVDPIHQALYPASHSKPRMDLAAAHWWPPHLVHLLCWYASVIYSLMPPQVLEYGLRPLPELQEANAPG